MSIQEERILGQDCTITVGGVNLLKFTEWELTQTKNKKESRAASATHNQFVVPYVGATLKVKGYRGGSETLADLQALFDVGPIDAISGTDLPTDLIMRYGAPSVMSLGATQDENEGKYDFQIEFGQLTHGYTATP